jgi:hypothetical protein
VVNSKVLNINGASPQGGEMFIDLVAEKNFLAPEERNVAFGKQTFRS